MTLAARARRAWWQHVRHYRYEVCGRPKHPHATIRRGCGRPVGLVWRAPSGTWNYVIIGEGTRWSVKPNAEGVGGVLCLACFDRFAQERDVHLQWESRPL